MPVNWQNHPELRCGSPMYGEGEGGGEGAVNEARARPLLKSGRLTLANGGIGGRLEKGNYGSGEVGQKNICITRFPS